MNLGTLNTIITLVVVLLVLSLVVQSIQTALKKLLKLKSKQIEDSLKDLFDQAIASGQPLPPKKTSSWLAKLKTLWSKLWGVEKQWSADAEKFKTGVLEQFKNVGRVTRFGNPVLDSLSKEDLIKVMAKLDLERYFPDYIRKLQDLCDQIKELRTAIESIASNQTLAGAASAKLSELRAVVTPLINDAQALVDDKQKVKPQVVFGDLLRLTKLEVASVLKLVAQAQTAVNAEIDKATQSSPPGDIASLQKISAALTTTAKVIGDLSQKFDEAVAPLRGKVSQVETWFDTVTQSFDERYTRHMRTVSICISIVVVVVLNANFFNIYNNISANELQKNLIAEAGSKLLDDLRQEENANKGAGAGAAAQNANASGNTGAQSANGNAAVSSPQAGAQSSTNSNANTNNQAGMTTDTGTSVNSNTQQKPGDQSSAGGSGNTNDSSTTSETVAVDYKKEVERTKQAIQLYVNTYEQFGFSPLSGRQINSFIRSSAIISRFWDCDGQATAWGCTVKRDDKGIPVNKHGKSILIDCVEAGEEAKGMDCAPAWRPQSPNEWWVSLKGNVTGLLGWAVMVVLLSVGAPFWQDTLESLFGIKNLLRQKSRTQNVETQSGAGQTK